MAVKSGRTAAGQRAASSHTGALLAASDVTVDALFAHAGVLRAETVGEMFDVAGLLARQPLPRGDRVAVLTNAGGPGILCADACEAAGLRIEPLSDGDAGAARRGAARRGLDREPGRHDRLGDGRPVRALAAHPARGRRRRRRRDDLRAPAGTRAAEVARGIAAAAEGADRPVLAVWLGADTPAAEDTGAVPALRDARGGGAGARPRRPLRAPPRGAADDPPFEPADADIATAATIVAEGLGRGGGWLPPDDVERLLTLLGHPGRGEPARRLGAAPRAAPPRSSAAPSRSRRSRPGLVHKSDAGAVRLGLDRPDRRDARRPRDGGAGSRRQARPSRASTSSGWRRPGPS